MRDRVMLVRVKHPALIPLEADLVYKTDEEVTAYIPMSVDDEHPPIQVGERLVLHWPDQIAKRGRAKVTEVEVEIDEFDTLKSGESARWNTVKVSLDMGQKEGNLRHYPRLLGGISLKFAPVPDHMNVESWLLHAEETEEEPELVFSEPLDSLMNFSVNGLKFECSELLSESTLLLCELGIALEEVRWRCLAKVIRVWNEDQQYSVAIHFVSPPESLINALSEFTLRIQKARV